MATEVLPRTRVRTVENAPVQRVPLDSARLLIGIESFRGTREPMRFASPMDVGRKLERTGVGIPAYDAVDVAFRSGVPEVYLARVLGPAAAPASLVAAGGTGTVFTISAHEPGEWANGAAGGLSIQWINGPAGASERIGIVFRGGVEIGRTVASTTRAQLLASLLSILQTDPSKPGLLDVATGADTGLPTVAAAANLAGGTADLASVTSTHVRQALDRVSIDEGPMQVCIPGRDTDAMNIELASYCAATGRTALAQQASGLSVATMLASAAAMRTALGLGATGKSRLAGMWAQYMTGPGVVASQSRTVPWTIIVAGLTARLQVQEGHPNVAPFGDYGVPLWGDTLSPTFTEAEHEQLVAGGINTAHTFLDVPRNRTFHTLEQPLAGGDWVDLAHTRVDRQVHAIARDEGRRMGARVISRNVISEFGGRLLSRLDRELFKPGALFGDTLQEAVRVDTDSTNDAITIRAKEVNAAVGLCMGEHAEFINVDLAKVPIGQAV